MLEKAYRCQKYQIGRLLPRIEEDGKSWLRGPKLYKSVVEPHKKKKKEEMQFARWTTNTRIQTHS
jgi:hypothetical protein